MYLNTETLTQCTERDIRAAFPNTSFSDPFTPPDGYVVVFAAPQPTYDPITQFVREIAPVLTTKGHWEQQWEVADLPVEVIAANQAAAAAALQASIIGGAQQRLDDFAKTRNYDGILSLCTYATDTNPGFAAEGQYGVQSRSATWAALYTTLAEVTAGTRPVPTGYADIEPSLPELVWPT